ncbi:MAG: sulfite exporter TauE/SafE family protein [Rhodobacterales bacterium]|nr:sulfite exporter TauE/SafE family protein [Rhodobacterales bacterium]
MAVLVAWIVGFSKGGWSAIGNLSVPLLSLAVDPLTAAGLLLPVYLISDGFGLWAYRHSYDQRVLKIMIPAGLLGIGLGWTFIPWINANLPGGGSIITGLVGGIGIMFAIYMLTGRGSTGPAREPKLFSGLFWGSLAGFTSYISHAGAPPYQTYVQPLRLDRLSYAGTTTILFATLNLAKLGPYWMTGQVSLGSLETAVYLMVPAIVGVYVGKKTVGMVSEATFYKVITWALLIIGFELLGKAIFGFDPILAFLQAAFGQ